MHCPACDNRFKRMSSWPLAVGRPIVCGACGTACQRVGKWKPLIIALVLLVLFQQLIGMFAFTGLGIVLLLAGLVLLAMSIDEATIQLTPVAGQNISAKGPDDPATGPGTGT
ncbi:MAG TPA: hypothetical protein DCG48_11750 [Rhodospirillaceae bacterium]|nr:hypothetical protein [Rhodospirillaceae bacterium]